MSDSVKRLTVDYLWKIGSHLATVCPPASRYAVHCMERQLLKDDQVKSFGAERQKMFCHKCGSIWSPGNHRVRIKPCPVASKNMKKLLKHQRDQPWNLTTKQKKRISTFQKSTNKIVYRCFNCQKSIVFPGTKKAKVPETVQNSSIAVVPSFIFKRKKKKRDINAGILILNTSK